LTADLDPAALTDREVDDAAMAPEHSAGAVNDFAGRLRLWTEPLHQPRIVAVRNEADVLAVGLGGTLEPHLRGDAAYFVLWQIAEREAQEVELLARRAVEEEVLVAPWIGALVQPDP